MRQDHLFITDPKKERTYLVNLLYAYLMAWPSGISIGTYRQQGILGHAQDLYFRWSQGSHDRNAIKKVAIVKESELVEFRRTLSSLRCGGYYERTALNSTRLYCDKLAVPFPQGRST